VKISVGDTRLFFDVDGAGLVPAGAAMRERPVVVLIHTGPGADHSLYKDHVGPALTDIAQVVYVDVRGAGRSDFSSPEAWNLDTWAGDVSALCEALELERPVLLGTAFGAYVALLVAARNPELVSRLVLVSAVARYSHTRSITVFDRLGGPEAGEIAARYFHDPGEETFADFLRVCVPLYTRTRLSPDVIARTEINIELAAHWDSGEGWRFDLRDEAARVRCPTLVLAGEDDPSTTLAGATELVDCLSGALVRFEHFPNVGHGVFRDAPAAIELVREFLLAPVETAE
jgi:pimeloyl-ACP methyl ester carboxylesterase